MQQLLQQFEEAHPGIVCPFFRGGGCGPPANTWPRRLLHRRIKMYDEEFPQLLMRLWWMPPVTWRKEGKVGRGERAVNGTRGWLDGWIDGWIYGWINRWTSGWMIEWMDQWFDGWMNGWMNGWIGGWMDEWMDGWLDGRMDGWVVGWMDEWLDGWMD